MDGHKIVVTASIDEGQLSRLRERCEVVTLGWGTTGELLGETELQEALKGAEVLIVGYERVSDSVIAASESLRLIACSRSNPVNVDVESASLRGIPLIFTPGRNANSAAEFTFGLILAEVRHIARAHHSLVAGRYLGPPATEFRGASEKDDVVWTLDGESPYKRFRGCELAERVLGLVGLGNIGVRVANLAHAFDMEVVSYDPYLPKDRAREFNVRLVTLEELLSMSDVISVHCKVTPETHGLLGKREFALMKPSAYLINTARAIIVDQEALIEALREHRIAGAALDVYWDEPLPSNHPLLSMDNVTLTPHLGGASIDVPKRHSKMIVDDVLAWLDGERPQRVFNPQVFATAI